MPETTKDRIVDASAELFQLQGYAGTGMRQIVARASAPFGSIYHHFPGGKEELGAETIRVSGALYLQLLDLFLDPAPDVVTGVEEFFAGAAVTLRESDYAEGCPIATVALEVASTSEPLRAATAEVFDSWIDAAAARFADAGLDAATARALAIGTIAGLEGAFVLCRALRSTEPMEVAGAVAVAQLRAALG